MIFRYTPAPNWHPFSLMYQTSDQSRRSRDILTRHFFIINKCCKQLMRWPQLLQKRLRFSKLGSMCQHVPFNAICYPLIHYCPYATSSPALLYIRDTVSVTLLCSHSRIEILPAKSQDTFTIHYFLHFNTNKICKHGSTTNDCNRL